MATSTRQWKQVLLEATDWTQLPDVALTQEEKDAWAVYRQNLRNINSDESLYSQSWPIPPSELQSIRDVIGDTDSAVLVSLNLYNCR